MVQPLEGTVSVREILSYLERDRFFDKRQASDYLSLCVRSLEARLNEIPHFRVGARTLFKKSELDQWMERHRENPEAIDLERLADEVVAQVLGRSE
jgi:excisionase family DNA binding protein